MEWDYHSIADVTVFSRLRDVSPEYSPDSFTERLSSPIIFKRTLGLPGIEVF